MHNIPHNIIGDIHGLPVWKSLVRVECTNVLVGDFFDPYENISYEDCKQNFMDIINYKKSNPHTILLCANHEFHYLYRDVINERYSRYDYRHATEIQKLLQDNASYFNGIAYSINNQYLVTHAGVSIYWYKNWMHEYAGQSPDVVAAEINDLWERDIRAFLVRGNMAGGLSAQSPLWIRPDSLENCNIFEGTPYKQIFGHTPCQKIEEKKGLICVDCLRNVNQIGLGNATFQVIQP